MTATQQRPYQMLATIINAPHVNVPCRYFHNVSGCWRGDHCHYQHIQYDHLKRQQQSQQPSPTLIEPSLVFKDTPLLKQQSVLTLDDNFVAIKQRLDMMQIQHNNLYNLLLELLKDGKHLVIVNKPQDGKHLVPKDISQETIPNKIQQIQCQQTDEQKQHHFPTQSPTTTPTANIIQKLHTKYHSTQKKRHKKHKKSINKHKNTGKVNKKIVKHEPHTKNIKNTKTKTNYNTNTETPRRFDTNTVSTDYSSTITYYSSATDSDGTQDTTELDKQYEKWLAEQHKLDRAHINPMEHNQNDELNENHLKYLDLECRVKQNQTSLLKSLETYNNDELIAEHSRKAEIENEKGKAAMKEQDFKTAAGHFEWALYHIPTDAKYSANAAAAFYSLEDHWQSLYHAKFAVELDPEYLKGHVRVTNAAYELGIYPVAQKHIQHLLNNIDNNNINNKRVIDKYTGMLRVCEDNLK